MARTSNKLTQLQIKNADPGKHFDGGGLFLHVQPSGTKTFRLKYRRLDGRENLYTIGPYPGITLAEARRQRDEVARQRREGIDPVEARRQARKKGAQRLESGFAQVANDWLQSYQYGRAPATVRKASLVIEEYFLPALRQTPIDQLDTPTAVAALERMASVPSLQRKGRQYLRAIERYAVRKGVRPAGPQLDLSDVLPRRNTRGHLPAATDLQTASAVIRAVDACQSPAVQAALRLLMYTAQRPGNVVKARWAEINWPLGEWHIRAADMKTGHDHIVPLPMQALAAIEAMKPISGDQEYVFPPISPRKLPHLNENALSLQLRKLGFSGRHTAHGFRAMFRTLGRERLRLDSEVLEAQLAHAKKGEVQAAYDRTHLLDERREAMQQWADFVDGLVRDDQVQIPIENTLKK